jgi:hypothetical protein
MPCAPIDLGKADHSAAVRARGALQVITEQWATPGNAKNDRPAGSAQLNRPATHCGGGHDPVLLGTRLDHSGCQCRFDAFVKPSHRSGADTHGSCDPPVRQG